MRKASLGTIFLTVFLDLLGFGLVVPFLPGVARAYGASDSVSTLLGTVYSLMQFLLIPVWGRLSDRVGRRPVLLWSIAASAIGMVMLGFASNLTLVFAARIWSGAATANIAVAQAYIADVTTPENRARGMGLIGVAFGLGFVFGPFIGGELGTVPLFGRPGALAAITAACLSAINLMLALRFLPESLPADLRGKQVRSASPFDLERFRKATSYSGVPIALIVNFTVIFAFAGMEQTFRLFTEDAFNMTVEGTGRVLGFVGVMAVLVQGVAIRPLTRLLGESRLIRAGVLLQACAFALLGLSPSAGSFAKTVLFAASGLIAVGSGLTTPSVSSYVSRRSDASSQGTVLGSLQSIGALARVFGPAAAGLVYEMLGHSATYYVSAAEMMLAAGLALGLEGAMASSPA